MISNSYNLYCFMDLLTTNGDFINIVFLMISRLEIVTMYSCSFEFFIVTALFIKHASQ